MSVNYNLDRDAAEGEFFSFLASLYVTRSPLDPLSYGVKLDAAYTLQNDVSTSNSPFQYRAFNSQLGGGGYARFGLAPHMAAGAEVGYAGRSYFGDAAPGVASRRTGHSLTARAFWQYDPGNRLLNPTVSLRLEKENADGSEFRSAPSPGVNLSNLFYLLEDFRFSVSVDFIRKQFDEASTARRENKLTGRLGATYRAAKRWTILGEISSIRNLSNVSTFDYRQTVISAGVSYSLF